MSKPTGEQLKKFLARQEKQHNWLDKMEYREIANSHRGLSIADYFWSCKTCNESGVHHDAKTMSIVLSHHAGHDTWLEYGGRMK
jgi:hypothetical protein